MDPTIKDSPSVFDKGQFSIIIPTYNRAEIIEKTIQSVLSQTYNNFELIIVDDGSKDNTADIIRSINDERLFYHKIQNVERGAARNYGTKLAKGDYITFLDSDDLFYPNHLKEALKLIKANNTPEIFHIRYDIKNFDHTNIKPQPVLKGDINRKLANGNFMSCQAVFLRKDIAKTNLFNEDRELTGEDWELWLRIASKHKIYYSNTITSALINHSSRSVLNINKQHLIYKVNTLLKYVLQNKEVVEFYKREIHKFKASCYTYIALHIALTKKDRFETIKYTLKGIKENPGQIFTRRFLAILKHFF